MSTSGFARDSAYSVFEALRPAEGQTLDRAAFATYSLDLVAVAALVLSLGRAGEQELEAGALGLVDALADIAPRIDIVYQKDRLKPAPRHHGVLHMLDRRIHAVQPPPGSSYHPKLALARYLGPRGTVSWKLWLGSRNLTGGQDREAGLLLVGSVRGARGSRIPAIASMASELLEPVGWLAALAPELTAARWRAPEGVLLRTLQWRAAGATKAFSTTLKGAVRTYAISPFVDDAGLEVFDGCAANMLLTTQDAACDVAPRADVDVVTCRPPTFEVIMPAEPPAAAPAIDEVSLPEPSGLHAKLLLRQSPTVSRLWIGSANLTGRGMNGPNAELMAELDVPPETAAGLIEFVRDGAPFDAAAFDVDPELATRRAAERALDRALAAVLDAHLELQQARDGLVLVSDRSFDDFLSGHRLESWLLTRPDAVAGWESGRRSITLVPGGVPLRLETVLVCFRAERTEQDCPARTWAQAVRFPSHDPDARDRAATAAYIGLAGASAWLRAQLDGIPSPGSTTWTGARRWTGSEFGGAEDELPLAIEEVLAAWARDPGEFEGRARQLEAMLEALNAELTQVPPAERDEAAITRWGEVRDFWRAIRQSIGDGA